MNRCPERSWRRGATARLGAAFAILSLAAAAAGAAPSYLSVTPVAGKYAAAVDLNDGGRYAVNNFGPDIPIEPAYISGQPLNENVDSLGGNITRIRSINNKGQAVGESSTADGSLHPFFYASGRTQDLSARYGIGSVNALNDRGDITGRTTDLRAMVIRDGRVDVVGPAGSAAGAINQAGDMLVEYYPPGRGIVTCVYSHGRCTDLPAFGTQSVASAINDAGWVSGTATAGDGHRHGWLYDGRTIADLTPAAANGAAYDVNDLGQVVGTMDQRAFLYADGRLIDLNTFVDPQADLLLTSAYAINNDEQILARTCDRAGVFCYGTVLLSGIPAVPEPPAAAMLVLALGLLAARRARRWRVRPLRPACRFRPGGPG